MYVSGKGLPRGRRHVRLSVGVLYCVASCVYCRRFFSFTLHFGMCWWRWAPPTSTLVPRFWSRTSSTSRWEPTKKARDIWQLSTILDSGPLPRMVPLTRRHRQPRAGRLCGTTRGHAFRACRHHGAGPDGTKLDGRGGAHQQLCNSTQCSWLIW